MSDSKNRVPVGVALFLVNREGKFLLGKRRGSHGAGTWALPGGAVDPGEHPTQTVRRELLEEAGIHCGGAYIFREHPWVNSIHEGVDAGEQWVCLFFVAPAVKKQDPRVMEPEKNEEWRWFSPSGLSGNPLQGALLEPLRASSSSVVTLNASNETVQRTSSCFARGCAASTWTSWVDGTKTRVKIASRSC